MDDTAQPSRPYASKPATLKLQRLVKEPPLRVDMAEVHSYRHRNVAPLLLVAISRPQFYVVTSMHFCTGLVSISTVGHSRGNHARNILVMNA